MAWIDKAANETADGLKTRLQSLGVFVHTSASSLSSIVAYNGGNVLRQKQDVDIYEYRGITEDAAVLLKDLEDDQTTKTVYYAQRASSSDAVPQYMAEAVTTGTRKEVQCYRANEGSGWVARVTETTYSAGGSGWSSTRPNASLTGVVVDKSKRSTSTEYGYGNTVVGYKLQQITTTVREYQFLTQQEAEDICVSSDGTTLGTIPYYDDEQNPLVFKYRFGTVVYSSMRYIDEVYGWTVTKTTEEWAA